MGEFLALFVRFCLGAGIIGSLMFILMVAPLQEHSDYLSDELYKCAEINGELIENSFPSCQKQQPVRECVEWNIAFPETVNDENANFVAYESLTQPDLLICSYENKPYPARCTKWAEVN